MAKLFNRAKMTTSTTGSGTVTLGSASVGYQSFADAGVSNGDVVQYVIEEGGNFEIGTGTYSATGTSLTRSPTESSNSDAAISLGGAATVSITAVADDLNRLQHEGSTKVEPSATGATVTGNLAVTGTVDGRDVATDGTKLDGIESNATADQTAAEIRSLVESATDSNVFTDADHTKLNGIEANATADQTASEIRALVESASDSNVFTDADHSKLNNIEAGATADQTITAGSGLTGGGTGNVTLSHADTSSQASVNGSGRTYIQDITLDTYGHVTGLATATETVVNTDTVPNNATITISAGNALTGGGNFTTDQASNETITINHQDTSSQSSVNNSGGTVIQDVTLDTYGHVTGLTSYNLDGRYYTETEADSRFVNVTGDTMSGTLDLEGGSFSSGIDTNTNAALVIASGERILGDDGNYLRSLLTWTSGNQIEIGQGSTSLITGVNIVAGSNGTVKANGQRVFAEDYHPNADKWTTARTLSLSGDASGSVSWDGSANASLSVTVADDSHNHVISNVDGLQTALDGKLSTSGKAADSNLLDGIDSGSFLRSDATDTFTTLSGTTLTASTLRAGDGNDGYFYSDSNGRTAFTGGDFYIQSGVSNCYVYATNTFLGATSGDNIYVRGNTISGNSWSITGAGAASFASVNINGNLNAVDNIYLAGTLYHEGDTNTYLSFGTDVVALATGGTDRVYVNNSGVRIGDTGNGYFQPVSGTYGSIQIDGGAHGGYEGYSIGGRAVFMHNNSGRMGLYDDVNNAWGFFYDFGGAANLTHNASTKLSTTSTGVTVTGDLNSTSDIRYKKNIETIGNALEKVQSLRGVTYNWDNDAFKEDDNTKKPSFTERATGVIAQDVEKVLPEAVRENEDGFKNVAYGNMVGLLIEAIKEQQEQIDELKKQLNG